MPREAMAQLTNPSLAGVLAYAIGPVGAFVVNLGLVISLLGAMLSYVIIAEEVPFEAAKQGVFPSIFAKINKKGVGSFTTIVSATITQVFLIVALASEGTYQFFYTCAVGTILVPYVCYALYYMLLGWRKKLRPRIEKLGSKAILNARLFGTAGFVYTLYLVYTTGIEGVAITSICFLPGILVYCAGQKERGLPLLESTSDKVIAGVIVIAFILSVTFIAPSMLA